MNHRTKLILLTALAGLTACSAPRPATERSAPIGAPSPLPSLPPASGGAILLAAPGDQANTLRVWSVDPATGEPSTAPGVIDQTLPGAEMSTFALSLDRQRLAVATGTLTFCEPSMGGSACWAGTETISLLNLTTGEVHQTELDRRGRVSLMAFDPSGRRLAMAAQTLEGTRLLILDMDAARLDGEVTLPVVPSILGYTSDGASLVVFGADPGSEPGMAPPGPAQVLVLNAADLSTEWNQAIDGLMMGSWCLEACESGHDLVRMMAWSPAFTLQASADRLLILHAESERLTTVDLRNRLVQSAAIGPAKSWLDRLMAWGTVSAEAKGWAEGAMKQLAISPDGSKLYSVGRLLHTRTKPDGSIEGWEEPLGLDVVDPATGVLQGHVETDAIALRLSADGRWLVLERWDYRGPVSQVVDTHSLEAGTSFEGWQILTVVSREGRSLLLATSQGPSTTRFALIDPATMQRYRAWTVDGMATVLTP